MESATFYNSLIQDYATLTRKITVSTRVYGSSGLRASPWQKLATLNPSNTRTCLVKQDQAGSYMWVTAELVY